MKVKVKLSHLHHLHQVLRGVTPDMDCYKTEIFGPVLCCVEVETLQDAIDLVNANEYGNGTAVREIIFR